MNPKNLKKSLLEPHKCQFGWGKTIGREKSQILTKNENLIFVYDFMLTAGAPNPIFCNEFVRFYYSKKDHFWGPFWRHLGPSCSQNPIFCNTKQWFYKMRFWAPKIPKKAPRTTKMAPSRPILALDSTPRQAAIRACGPKRFILPKPLET